MIQMLDSKKTLSKLLPDLSHSQNSAMKKVSHENGGSPVNSPSILWIMQNFLGVNEDQEEECRLTSKFPRC